MTQDPELNIIHKTGSTTNRKQHAVGCEYIHTVVNCGWLTVCHTPDVYQELHDQVVAAWNGKPPWSTKAFLHTVREIEHHNVVSSGLLAEEFGNKHPRQWTKHALITLEEGTEAYMVEIIAASHCLKQQPISCRYSTYLLQWQGKELVYRWNSPTCA